jgi:hypothetical protein
MPDFSEPTGRITTRLVDKGCQPAFRVGTTKGTLSVSDRSKRYWMLLKMPRKSLTILSLQICQGSGVGSIPIGRSIKSHGLHFFLRILALVRLKPLA